MDPSVDDIIDQFDNFVRSKCVETISFHRRHGSTAEHSKLLDIGARHVKEHLERMADALDNEERHELADAVRALEEERAPFILRQLRDEK